MQNPTDDLINAKPSRCASLVRRPPWRDRSKKVSQAPGGLDGTWPVAPLKTVQLLGAAAATATATGAGTIPFVRPSPHPTLTSLSLSVFVFALLILLATEIGSGGSDYNCQSTDAIVK